MNANSFPDGNRGGIRGRGDLSRVAEYAASTLPTRGPGMVGRRFPQGTTGFPLSVRRAVAALNLFPWQAYKSKWKGTGADPSSANRVMRFRLRRGKVNARTPSNMMDEFVAFGDASDTGIEEADAVYTQVYVQQPVSETGLGTGLFTYDRGTIKIVEGDDLEDAGVTDPAGGGDGSVPAYKIVPICEVAWWGGTLHFPPGVENYLNLSWKVSGTDCEHAGRNAEITGS